ncbi:MAG: LysM domain-containing protein [Candidatus Moraniibacteriota bacterium]
MKKTVVLVAFLVATLFSSEAFAGTCTVKAGDTFYEIAQKNGVTRTALQEANPQIKNINRILIGQSIYLPEKDIKVREKKISEWLPGSAPTKATPYYAIQELPSFKRLTIEQQRIIFQKIVYEDYRLVDIPDGTIVYEMTYTSKSGKTQVIKNRRANLSKTGPLKVEAYSDPAVPIIFVRVVYCNNMSYMGITLPEIQEPKKGEEKKYEEDVTAPPEEEALPPIFVSKTIEKTCVVAENELDIGAGIWKSGDSKGGWGYIDYERYIRSCKNTIHVFDGVLTPIIGIFARGNVGEVDSGYKWDEAGIGPQAGAMWNGTTSAGYPHQVKVMLRFLYDYAHGANSLSGYSKSEQHILVGTYLEYLRRFHPEYMYILYSEGWFDVFRSFSSTWSGDKASNITSLNIGAKLHKDINSDWAVRLGVQLGFQPEETRIGGNVNIELRYCDWLIFGPSLDYAISSDIPTEVGGWATGVFARVELRRQVKESYTETYMSEVTPSDKELLDY